MILLLRSLQTHCRCYPCTSGDDPITLTWRDGYLELSLHKRGWSLSASSMSNQTPVIPAQAGMILNNYFLSSKKGSYPCTSGDDPAWAKHEIQSSKLSLHKRGWSWLSVLLEKQRRVIPAQAGMILPLSDPFIIVICYPCTSGDDPTYWTYSMYDLSLSLHKRGWS